MHKIVGAFVLVLFIGACVDSGFKCFCDAPWSPQCYQADVKVDPNSKTGKTSKNGTTNGTTSSAGGGNNGFGNGDQDAPGNSADHNSAENDRGGRSDPSHGGRQE